MYVGGRLSPKFKNIFRCVIHTLLFALPTTIMCIQVKCINWEKKMKLTVAVNNNAVC